MQGPEIREISPVDTVINYRAEKICETGKFEFWMKEWITKQVKATKMIIII